MVGGFVNSTFLNYKNKTGVPSVLYDLNLELLKAFVKENVLSYFMY